MAHTNHSGVLSNVGYWGSPSSTLDWCEINYQFSYYVAEMVNTFSNLFSVFISFYSAYISVQQKLPPRYAVCFAGCALIAVGSFAFHCTLLYQAQLADELPMIYVTSMNLFLLLDTKPGFDVSARTIGLIGGLATFDSLFTYSYFLYRNPLYHQFVFGAKIVAIVARITYIMHRSTRYSKIPTKSQKDITKLMVNGAVMFLTGWGIWNLDNELCESLIRVKIAVGWPWAFLLEGHAWWHVLTALGSYMMVVGMTYLTLSLKDDHSKYTLATTSLGLPYCTRVPKSKSQ